MEPLYKEVCANCGYLSDSGIYDNTHYCVYRNFEIPKGYGIEEKTFCDEFVMDDIKAERTSEHNKIVNKLIGMDRKELLDFIVTHLDYDNENDEWIAHI